MGDAQYQICYAGFAKLELICRELFVEVIFLHRSGVWKIEV